MLNHDEKLIPAVAEFADAVLARCGDTYGPTGTPLLVDAIDPSSGEPQEWEGSVLSNLACQQNFLRVLDALATLTGDTAYRTKADEWIGHALHTLRNPASDLLHWGGHSTFDLRSGRPLTGNHELKCVYPHYDYLYRVDAEITGTFVDAFWHAHIWDWQTLLFNRHGEYVDWNRDEAWQGQFAGGPVPIIENSALSFVNTGSDLIFAAAEQHRLSGRPEPLHWARHLLSRYDDVRHPDTGLAGYQFNHREPCRVRASFTDPLGQRTDVNEVTVLTSGTIRTRYGRAALTFLNIFEALGAEAGADFGELVTRDLTALAEHAWDEDSHSFSPILYDGTRISPDDAVEGVGYSPPSKLQLVRADGLMFLSYARAYRLTGVERFRDMAAGLAVGMGWGDIGQPVDFSADASDGSAVSPPTMDTWAHSGQNDACALVGLLELADATGDDNYLRSAASLGQRLLREYCVESFYTTSGSRAGGQHVSIDGLLPLALLHLAAALGDGREHMPTLYANNTYFDPKIVVRQKAAAQQS